jgi:hypothetical protein
MSDVVVATQLPNVILFNQLAQYFSGRKTDLVTDVAALDRICISVVSSSVLPS